MHFRHRMLVGSVLCGLAACLSNVALAQISPALFSPITNSIHSISLSDCLVRPDFEVGLLFDWSEPKRSGLGSASDQFVVEGISTWAASVGYIWDYMLFSPERVGRSSRTTVITNDLGVVMIYEAEISADSTNLTTAEFHFLFPHLDRCPVSGKWLAEMDDGTMTGGGLDSQFIDYAVESGDTWWRDQALSDCMLTFQCEAAHNDGFIATGTIRNGRKEGVWWVLQRDGTLQKMQFKGGLLDGPHHCWHSKLSGVGTTLYLNDSGAMIGYASWDELGRLYSVSWGNKYQIVRETRTTELRPNAPDLESRH